MSTMGNYIFLSHQSQTEPRDVIFISQDKYVPTCSRSLNLVESSKRAKVTPKDISSQCCQRIFKYLKGKPNFGLWNPRESPLDWKHSSDSDYGVPTLQEITTECSKSGGRNSIGQPQPSADPTPSQSIPATSLSHVQIPQPPPTHSESNQLSPSPQIPSPSFHDTEGPSFEPSYHMSPPPSHEPEIQASISSEESEQLRNLMDIVPRLESRVKSLEKELSETKQTLGTALLQLIEKVKKLENKLRKRGKVNKLRIRGSWIKKFLLDTDQDDTFVTPERQGSGRLKKNNKSFHFRGCTDLNNCSSEGLRSQADLGLTPLVNTAELNPDSTPSAQVNTGEVNAAEVNTGEVHAAEVNTGEAERVQRRKEMSQ
ncbi:hypothetical protein Tco_0923939 [Tanacetum coccineum]|uniref:Uncharacterized protein n=1 Tax=Tanacetum coccineum TaxID=301880 RepID=A0ABQ5D3S7_9ASTR